MEALAGSRDWLVYASALAIGFAFGYVVQRGGFCLSRGFARFFAEGDSTTLCAWSLALFVAALGVRVIAAGHLAEIPIRPFRWVANPVGGMMFGFGIILAGACSASAWVKLGEGVTSATSVLVGLAVGVTMVSVGPLAPMRQMLQAPTLTVAQGSPTLYDVTGLPALAVSGVFLIPLAWLLWQGEAASPPGLWSWPLTGTAVGVVVTLGWWASSLGGSPSGLTVASNTGHWLTHVLVRYPARLAWGAVLLPGVALGGFVGARRWRGPLAGMAHPRSVTRSLVGGLIMGIGAAVGEGCNVGQGLSNSAALALGSLSTWLPMTFGAWLAVRLARPSGRWCRVR